jgi:hypothetical protein
MRYLSAQFKRTSRLEMMRICSYREPHLAIDYERLDREFMDMRWQRRQWRPSPLHHFIETLPAVFRLKLLEALLQSHRAHFASAAHDSVV